jgi:hypothetical protein
MEKNVVLVVMWLTSPWILSALTVQPPDGKRVARQIFPLAISFYDVAVTPK